jgi:hypothetical protein
MHQHGAADVVPEGLADLHARTGSTVSAHRRRSLPDNKTETVKHDLRSCSCIALCCTGIAAAPCSAPASWAAAPRAAALQRLQPAHENDSRLRGDVMMRGDQHMNGQFSTAGHGCIGCSVSTACLAGAAVQLVQVLLGVHIAQHLVARLHRPHQLRSARHRLQCRSAAVRALLSCAYNVDHSSPAWIDCASFAELLCIVLRMRGQLHYTRE